jgi:hypothetical protein
VNSSGSCLFLKFRVFLAIHKPVREPAPKKPAPRAKVVAGEAEFTLASLLNIGNTELQQTTLPVIPAAMSDNLYLLITPQTVDDYEK